MDRAGAVPRTGDDEAHSQNQVSSTQAWMERYTRRIKPNDRKWRCKSLRRGGAESLPASTKFGDEVVSKVLLLARWRSKARKHLDGRGFSMAARRPWLSAFRDVSERSGVVFGAALEHDGVNPHVEMILQVTHAEQDRRLEQAAEQHAKEFTSMDAIQQRVKRAMQGVKLWTSNGSRTVGIDDEDVSVRGGRRRASLLGHQDGSVRNGGGSGGGVASVAAARRHSVLLLSSVPPGVEGSPPLQSPVRPLLPTDASKRPGNVDVLKRSEGDVFRSATDAARVAQAGLAASAAGALPMPASLSRPAAADGVRSVLASPVPPDDLPPPPKRQSVAGREPVAPGISSPVRAAAPGGSPSPVLSSPPPLPPPHWSPRPSERQQPQHQPASPSQPPQQPPQRNIWPDRDELSASGLDSYLGAAAAAAETAAAETAAAAAPTLPGLTSPSLAELGSLLSTRGSLPAPGAETGAQRSPAATHGSPARNGQAANAQHVSTPYTLQRQQYLAQSDPAATLQSAQPQRRPEPPAEGAAVPTWGADGAAARGRDAAAAVAAAASPRSLHSLGLNALAAAPPPGPLHDVMPSLGGLDMCRVGTAAPMAAAAAAAATPPLTLTRQVRGGPLPHSLTMTKRGRRPAAVPTESEASTVPLSLAAVTVLGGSTAFGATAALAPPSGAGGLSAQHGGAAAASLLGALGHSAAGKSSTAAKPKSKTLGRALSVRIATAAGPGHDSLSDGENFEGRAGGELACPSMQRALEAHPVPSLTRVDATAFWGADVPHAAAAATPFSRSGTLSRAHSLRQPHPHQPHLPLNDLSISPSTLKPAGGGGGAGGAGSMQRWKPISASGGGVSSESDESESERHVETVEPISPVSPALAQLSLAPLSPSNAVTAAAAGTASGSLAFAGRSASGRMLASWPGAQPLARLSSHGILALLPALDSPQPPMAAATVSSTIASQLLPGLMLQPLQSSSSAATAAATASGHGAGPPAGPTKSATTQASGPVGLAVGSVAGAGTGTGSYGSAPVRVGGGVLSPARPLSVLPDSTSPTSSPHSPARRDPIRHQASSGISDVSNGSGNGASLSVAAATHGASHGGAGGGGKGGGGGGGGRIRAANVVSERLTSRTVRLVEAEDLPPTAIGPGRTLPPAGRNAKSLSSLPHAALALQTSQQVHAASAGGGGGGNSSPQRPLRSSLKAQAASATDLAATLAGGSGSTTAGAALAPLPDPPPLLPDTASHRKSAGGRQRGASSGVHPRTFLPELRNSTATATATAAGADPGARRSEAPASAVAANSRLLPALGLGATAPAAVSVGGFPGR